MAEAVTLLAPPGAFPLRISALLVKLTVMTTVSLQTLPTLSSSRPPHRPAPLPLPSPAPWPLSYIFSLSTFTVVSYPASSDDSTPASSCPTLNYI